MASILDKYIQQLNVNTSPARTPAGVLNPTNVDPRLAKEYQGLVSAVNTGISRQPAGTDTLSKYLRSLTDVSKPTKKKLNPLQQVLSNKVVQAGLKPLEYLDYGRRGLTSLAKESYDYGKTGTFSVEELKKQTEDPTFGVGQFVNTGNKWADRGFGFAGDVALDPLNYLTLGAGQFIGAGGRAALATKLLSAGADEVVISKAGRLGLAGLSAAEREAYNLPRAGLYVGQTLRIPGTEIIGKGLGRTLAETRTLLGSTPVGGVVRRARTPQMFIEAAERLATGKGPMSAKDATALLASAKVKAGVEGAVKAEIDQELRPIVDRLRSYDGPTVTNALERGDVSDPVFAEVRQQFDNNFNRMADPNIGAISPDRYLPNYVPRVWTEAGRNILSDESKFARDFRAAFGVSVDEIRSPSATMSRVLKIEPGKVYDIGGKQLTFATDTIDEINRVFAREFPELGQKKVLEDNIVNLLSGHSRQTAQAIGNQALARRLEAFGTGKSVALLAADVVDKNATKAAEKVQKKTTAKFVKDMEPQRKAAAEAVKVANKEYNDAVLAAGKSVAQTLDAVVERMAANGVALGEELQQMEKAFQNFMVRNQTAQVALEEQGRNLDNMSEWLTDFIDTNNTKLEVIAGFPESPEGVRLLAEKEYADTMLASVKEMQASLDSSIQKIDGALVDLPTKGELGKAVDKVSKTRMLPEPKYVEPYRIVSGGEVVGREKNKIIQFTTSLDDTRNLVKTFSPEAHNQLVDAGVMLDDASKVASAIARNNADVRIVEEAIWKRDTLQSRYDALKGIADRYNERTAKLRTITSYEGQPITAMPPKVIKSLFDDEDFGLIKMFEQEVMPQVNRSEKVFAERADLQRQATLVSDNTKRAEAKIANAKELAMREVEGMVDTPFFSNDVQNRIMQSYENLFENYQKGVDVVRRLNSINRDNLTSTQARTAILDAAAITANLEEAAFRFRVHADFANRYKGVISQVAASGQPFNADAIAGYVIKDVLASEIKNTTSKLNILRQTEQKIIKGLIDDTATGGQVGNVSKIKLVAQTIARNKDKDSTTLRNLFQDYLDTLYEFNKATRGSGTTRKISEKDLKNISETSVDDISSSGYSTTDLATAGKEQLEQNLVAARTNIKDFINSRFTFSSDEPFDFAEWKYDVIIPGAGKQRTRIDDDALKAWFDKSYDIKPEQPSKYLRYSEEAREAQAKAGFSGQSEVALKAISEQIQTVEKRLSSLKENAKLFGRTVRVSAEDKNVLSNVLDMNDPVAISNDLAEKTVRRNAIVGTKQEVGELQKLDEAIAVNRKKYSSIARKQKYVEPTGESQKNLVKYNTRVIDLKEQIAKQGDNVPDYLVRQLEDAQRILSSAENAQLKFSGSNTTLKNLTTEHSIYVAKRVELNKELSRLNRDISINESLLNNPAIQIKLGKNKAIKNWESVLFDPGLGKNKYAARNLFNAQANLIREQIGLRIESEAAKASADAAQAAIDDVGKRVVGTSFGEAEAATKTALSLSNENLDQIRLQKQQLDLELDNTKQIAIDSAQAESEALMEVRGQFGAVERNAQQIINERNKLGSSNIAGGKGLKTIEASSKWLDEALAMTDPQKYIDRLGVTDTVGNLIGGTSEAQRFAFLFSMNYTPEQKATAALVAKAHSLEGKMLTAVENRQAVEAMVRGAKDLKFPAIMKQQLESGWQEISKTGIAVPQAIDDAMKRIMRLDQPNEWKQFWSAWDTYTDVFKAYATLSPRFHVRNSLSATLMNYSDGVSTKSMIDGAKYWKIVKNDPVGWRNSVSDADRKIIDEAVFATYASGAGQYADFKIGAPGTRNRIVKASQNIGTTVEGSVRLGMAIDTLRNGGSFDEAVARINRVHFNYSDVSKVDGYAKKVIPFWTFMSRNIPLQMQQMWLKPRMYAIYGSAVRNFSDKEDGSIVPSYMMDSGAFRSPIGGGVITPDMPWISAQEDIMSLASPKGWVSSASPIVKVPLELYSGKQAFSGAPIGNPAMYALRQALPMLGTAERIGGVGSQGAKQGTNISQFLGVPYAQPTVSQQKAELIRRTILAQQATPNLRK